MTAYGINYHIRNKETTKYFKTVDAKDLASAKKKLGKKHGYKDGRMIIIDSHTVIGYF